MAEKDQRLPIRELVQFSTVYLALLLEVLYFLSQFLCDWQCYMEAKLDIDSPILGGGMAKSALHYPLLAGNRFDDFRMDVRPRAGRGSERS